MRLQIYILLFLGCLIVPHGHVIARQQAEPPPRDHVQSYHDGKYVYVVLNEVFTLYENDNYTHVLTDEALKQKNHQIRQRYPKTGLYRVDDNGNAEWLWAHSFRSFVVTESDYNSNAPIMVSKDGKHAIFLDTRNLKPEFHVLTIYVNDNTVSRYTIEELCRTGWLSEQKVELGLSLPTSSSTDPRSLIWYQSHEVDHEQSQFKLITADQQTYVWDFSTGQTITHDITNSSALAPPHRNPRNNNAAMMPLPPGPTAAQISFLPLWGLSLLAVFFLVMILLVITVIVVISKRRKDHSILTMPSKPEFKNSRPSS